MSYESTTEHIICTLSISSKIFSDTYLKHVNPNKNRAPLSLPINYTQTPNGNTLSSQ